MGKIATNPAILTWARETAHLTLEDVAKSLKKDPKVIESWENGTDFPTYPQLEVLSYSLYKRPLAVFFFPSPPKEENPEKSFRTLPDTEIEALSPQTIKLIRKAKVFQINLRELCDNKNPSRKHLLKNIKADELQTTAASLRKFLNFSLYDQTKIGTFENALNTWREKLEESGVFLFKDAFKNDNISGFCLFDNEFPIIYINNSMPKSRQIFTIFHEIAHLLFETSGIDKNDDSFIETLKKESRNIEIFCNKFAGEFLLPESEVKKEFKGVSSTNEELFQSLSQKYKVSKEVILRRFLDFKIINQDIYEKYSIKWHKEYIKLKDKQESSQGNYYNTLQHYLGQNYLNLTFKAYYQRKISQNQLADYLGIKISSIPGIEQTIKAS
ncbi:ImmA/IrrE family metallo-endopeptidase [Leptospira sp. 'Mane']|uniref:ImmA/IrrE family metallo-endopeptidase n=1 Tax=Leptospira sp. 'Mane' TaxID=3387407 RepID=UPI00398AE556